MDKPDRTLEDALALADEWRGHESVGEDVYTDLVLLANEVARLNVALVEFGYCPKAYGREGFDTYPHCGECAVCRANQRI